MYKSLFFFWLLLLPWITVQAQNPNTCRVVFTVNMQEQNISEDGIYILGNFFNEMDLPMDHIGNGLYQYVIRITKNDTLVYNFKNGLDQQEFLPTGLGCLVDDASGRRTVVVPDADSLEVPIACYASCMNCEQITSTVDLIKEQQIQLLPNIISYQTQLVWEDAINQKYKLQLFNSSGQFLRQYHNVQQSPFVLKDLPVQAGMYLLTIQNEEGEMGILKLLIK